MQIKDFPEQISPQNTDKLLMQDVDGATKYITRSTFLQGVNSSGGLGQSFKYIQLLDLRPSGESGGASTVGSWEKRNINNIKTDQTNQATIANNMFVLPPGNYHISALAMIYEPGEAKLRLFNITDNQTLINGINAYQGYVDAAITLALTGYFSVQENKELCLEYRCNIGRYNFGQGLSANFGVDEIYTTIDLWKLQ